jgi:hypothetical protein
MAERDPNWHGARIDAAGETPQLPKLGAAWVQPAPESLSAGLMAYGATMLESGEYQGLFGSTAGRNGGLAWPMVGVPGAGASGLAGDAGGLRTGALDSRPNPIGTLPSPVTVGISPEYLGLVTAAGTTVAAVGTIFSSVLAARKDRRERRADGREQEKHALAIRKLELEIAQAATTSGPPKASGQAREPLGKNKT